MKRKFIFSIIVVSLNTKKDFLKTIKSIFSQTFKDYQIIVVDGKSSDGSVKIIYKNKKKFKDIIIEEDRGIYDAMNKGLKKVKCPWIIFLNSGDIFYNKNTLRNIYKELNSKIYKDIYVGKNIVSNKFSYLSNFKMINKFSTSSNFSHQSTVCKSELFKKKKFDIKFKIAADYEFFKYCFLKKKKFFYSKTIISKSKPDGISNKNRIIALGEFYKINKIYNKNGLLTFFIYIKDLIYVLISDIVKKILPQNFIFYLIKIKKLKNFVVGNI